MNLLTSLRIRTGFIEPRPELALLPELVRHFLTPAIKNRATVLADAAKEPVENYLEIVSQGYTQRMENALAEEIASLKKEKNQELAFIKAIDGQLREVYFRSQLAEADFSNPANFEKLLQKARAHFRFAGLYKPLPLPPHEARAVASVMLRSLQKVALQIVSNDYPATAKKIVVPPTTQETIRKLLGQLNDMGALLLPNPVLETLSSVEAELNVAIARSELRVSLPVRSIPTAPLNDQDLKEHYVGRPDKDAQNLARAVRHADGTILVTGYRGVGKSSFVNRVIYHALNQQQTAPADGWLLVPVTINLAKVSGVQNILRLALRSVRNALINSNNSKPNPIPGFAPETPLPLNDEKEIQPLQEAYTRATYKVTMTRGNATESKFAFDGSLGFDVSKLLPATGLQLPSLLFKGSRSRSATLNRNLSLLDYDENAAEDDLMALIRNLAEDRPLYGASGPGVRVKLVFIFDELDKMDTKTGLIPMIEGLKNLFLQRYAVFILVTSKMFYYDLLAERAKEDSMLSSYFSAIVPVPLLTFEQARKMVRDWIEWPGGEQAALDNENNLLEQLTRWLIYKSYGNPRDIIRELRQMQDWADTTERPYLTDRLTTLQSLPIFAEIQKSIENVARAQSDKSTVKAAGDGEVTMVSERFGGDESRLEQVRRGLYILTEVLITQETLYLTPEFLEKMQKDNFSLLRTSDIEQLAMQLGSTLSLMHTKLPMDVFLSINLPQATELFLTESGQLRTTAEFYRLTGRQVTLGETEKKAPTDVAKNPKEMVSEAEGLASLGGPEQLGAIGIIKQLGTANIGDKLERFLVDLSTNAAEPSAHRRKAASLLTSAMLFKHENNLVAVVTQERDAEVLALLLPLLGKAAGDDRKRAEAAVLALFKMRADPIKASDAPAELRGKNAETALAVLQAVASHDVLDDVIDWLANTTQTGEVQETALITLSLLAESLKVDEAEKILSNNRFLKFFVEASQPKERFELDYPYDAAEYEIVRGKYEAHLRGLFVKNPLRYLERLLHAEQNINVNSVLTPLWQAAFDGTNRELPEFILRLLAREDDPLVTERLVASLKQVSEFHVRLLPYLKNSQASIVAHYTDEQRKKVEARLAVLATVEEIAKPIESSDADKPTDLQTKIERIRQQELQQRDLVRRTGYAAIGTLLAIPTIGIDVFLFKRDLPPFASTSAAVSSRILLLAADSCFVAFLLTHLSRLRHEISSASYSYSKGSDSTFAFVLGAIGFALMYVHGKYIGPLNFLNQIWLFLINLPAALLFGTVLMRRSARLLSPRYQND